MAANGKTRKNLKKSAEPAKSPELKRPSGRTLTQVFDLLGKPARAKTREAMQGITAEMEEDLEDCRETAAADAVLIG